jgi:hypothetical protein
MGVGQILERPMLRLEVEDDARVGGDAGAGTGESVKANVLLAEVRLDDDVLRAEVC